MTIYLYYVYATRKYNNMTKTIFVIVAVVAFTLATFGVSISHVALVPLGLAFYAAKELIK